MNNAMLYYILKYYISLEAYIVYLTLILFIAVT